MIEHEVVEREAGPDRQRVAQKLLANGSFWPDTDCSVWEALSGCSGVPTTTRNDLPRYELC